MQSFWILLVGIVILYFLIKIVYNQFKPQNWQGFYYPNGDTLVDMPSPVFSTKEQCLDWILNIKSKRDNPSDDYECGLNCRREPGRLVSVCEQTVDN